MTANHGKAILLFLAVIVDYFPSGLSAREIHANTAIRVLLDCCARTIELRYLTGPVEIVANSRVVITHRSGRLRMRWHSAGRTFVNDTAVHAALLQIKPSFAMTSFQVRAQAYRGSLDIHPTDHGMMIINRVGLEDYLSGILAGEMSAQWELEALKAQAVASRSFAHYKILYPRSSYYDVVAGTQDQVYVGTGIENERILKAVRETSGLRLWQNGSPFSTHFHSRCGGKTKSAAQVWSHSKAPPASVSCEYCQTHKNHWKAEVSRQQLFNAFGISPLSHDSFALLADRDKDGHVRSLTVRLVDNTATLASDRLRALLGYTRIKSAFFDVKIARDNMTVFEGNGNGHGVGMCQWGARHLAKLGKTFREILVYYYPGSEVK